MGLLFFEQLTNVDSNGLEVGKDYHLDLATSNERIGALTFSTETDHEGQIYLRNINIYNLTGDQFEVTGDGINVYLTGGSRGVAYPNGRIEIPSLNSLDDLQTLLHEVGHIEFFRQIAQSNPTDFEQELLRLISFNSTLVYKCEKTYRPQTPDEQVRNLQTEYLQNVFRYLPTAGHDFATFQKALSNAYSENDWALLLQHEFAASEYELGKTIKLLEFLGKGDEVNLKHVRKFGVGGYTDYVNQLRDLGYQVCGNREF